MASPCDELKKQLNRASTQMQSKKMEIRIGLTMAKNIRKVRQV